MQALMSFMVFSLISGYISCHGELKDIPQGNVTHLEQMLDKIGLDLESDMMDGVEELDSDGCDKKLLQHFIDRCDEVYEKVNNESRMMEDEEKRREAVCCALEDFEKCSLRAYDQVNCVTDKAAIRENLRGVRIFLRVIEDISCDGPPRYQCPYYNSAVVNYAGYTMVLFSVLVQLTWYWPL